MYSHIILSYIPRSRSILPRSSETFIRKVPILKKAVERIRWVQAYTRRKRSVVSEHPTPAQVFSHKTEMVANFAPVVGCSGASRCAGAFWLALIKPAPVPIVFLRSLRPQNLPFPAMHSAKFCNFCSEILSRVSKEKKTTLLSFVFFFHQGLKNLKLPLDSSAVTAQS